MTPIALHPVIFYMMIGFLVMMSGMAIYCLWLVIKNIILDTIIFIDQSDRWTLIKDKIGNTPIYTHNNKKYVIGEAILNRKGKALYVFSVNKPNPMAISYNQAKWLDSGSLMSVINNKLVQQLVKTTDALKDSLVLYGAIGGMIAGMASVVVLLKVFEVL